MAACAGWEVETSAKVAASAGWGAMAATVRMRAASRRIVVGCVVDLFIALPLSGCRCEGELREAVGWSGE